MVCKNLLTGYSAIRPEADAKNPEASDVGRDSSSRVGDATLLAPFDGLLWGLY